MKLIGNDKYNLMIYRWHSINIIPHISFSNTCKNDSPPFTINGRLIYLTLFGLVFNFTYPTTKGIRFRSFPGIDHIWWCYSRDQKRWYKYGKENL